MLLEVQCEVSTVSDDLGCHIVCWCWSTVFSEVHSQRSHLPRHFRALHPSFCWQAICRCWFHFPAGHTAKGTKSWFNDHGVTVLDWPANLPDLNPIENVKRTSSPCQEEEERHQTQQCRRHEGRYQSNLGFHYTWAVPQIASKPRRIDAVIHAKGDPTKYWVHRNEHTFQKPDISV